MQKWHVERFQADLSRSTLNDRRRTSPDFGGIGGMDLAGGERDSVC